jgi:folate-binding protein YgfZ
MSAPVTASNSYLRCTCSTSLNNIFMVNKEDYSRARNVIGFYDQTASSGRIVGRGRDAVDLLHRMSTNDLKPVEEPMHGSQTVLTTEKGRILDLVTVINRGTDTLLLTSKDHEAKLIAWLDKFTIMDDARFTPAANEIDQYLLIGRGAYQFIKDLLGVDPSSIERFSILESVIASKPVLIQKSIRIAESGWIILVDRENGDVVKQALEAEVREMSGSIMDDELFDLLRIESGIPVAPNELNEKHNPLEAALVSAVSFTKGCYIGQEVIARLDSYDKVQRHLMGLILSEDISSRTLPAKLYAGGEEAGELTSAQFSPALDRMIGLGYVRNAYANAGSELTLVDGDKKIAALMQKLPFEMELV